MEEIGRAKRILLEQNEVLKRRIEFMSRHNQEFKEQIDFLTGNYQ
jgi:hypothetical protein